MNWVSKVLWMSVLIVNACLFEETKDVDESNWVEKKGSAHALNEVKYNLEGGVVVEYKSTRSFKMESLNEEDQIMIISSEDSICVTRFNEVKQKREFEWDEYGKDTLNYTYSEGKLVFIWAFLWSIDKLKTEPFLGEWIEDYNGFEKKATFTEDSVRFSFREANRCKADNYIFEGSIAVKVDCNTVKMLIGGDEYFYGYHLSEEGLVYSKKYKDESCSFLWVNEHEITEKSKCVKDEKILNSSDCDRLDSLISDKVGPNMYMCTKEYLNDGACDKCLNMESVEGCGNVGVP
jgi:hypothetical protein